MQLRPEDLLILSSIKISPTRVELEQTNKLILQVQDWDYLTKTAIEHQAGPLLYKKLSLLSNQTNIPEATRNSLKQSWLRTLSRSMVLIEHFKKISGAFNTEGISFIAMKGILLSEWLYHEIGLRQFSDMDLLVKKEDGEKCIGILRAMGYQSNELKLSKFVKENTEYAHFPPMVKNGVSVEIHIKISRESESYHVNLSDLWKQAKPVTLHGAKALAFDVNDLLLHLCLHLDKHFSGGKVQFTCFYDITNLLEQHAADIDWERFKDTCIRYNAVEQTYPYIYLSAKYMNVPIPKSAENVLTSLRYTKKERLFIALLKGKTHENYSGFFRSLKKLGSPLKIVRYLFEMTFPSKEFMLQRYHIRRKSLLFLYYPFRILTGLKAACGSIINKYR